MHLCPVWGFRHFPSQDGPTHLYNARVLGIYGAPQQDRLREYYEINARPDPSWLDHLVLASLVGVVPPPVAEKLVLSGFLVLFPLLFRATVSDMKAGGSAAAFLAFPLLCTFTFHMGFYAFCYGLVLFVALLRAFVRGWPDYGSSAAFTMTSLALLLFAFHVVAFALAGVAIVLLMLSRARSARWNAGLLIPALSFLPAGLWAAALIATHKRIRSAAVPDWDPRALFRRIADLVSYRQEELLVFRGLALCIGGLVIALLVRKVRERRWSPWDGFLAVWLVYALLAIKSPAGMGGMWLLPQRFTLMAFLAAILWLGAQRLGRKGDIVATGGGIVLAILLLGIHCQTYARLDDLLDEYDSAIGVIPDGATVLPLNFAVRDPFCGATGVTGPVAPFLHAAARIGWRRDIVDLTNYEAHLHLFPLWFRASRDPWLHVGDVESLPTHLDLSSERFGVIDYVLVWGMKNTDIPDRDDLQEIVAQLERGYSLIHRSPQRGLLRVYRRRTTAAEGAPSRTPA
ncbi:MAG: hypothetical protein ABI968_00155 [Acidobacteriota bacterium]